MTQTIFKDISDEQFKKVVNVNMWGVYPGIRVFLPHFRTRPEAVIVNMSSLAGLVGLYGYSPYAMSKFAHRGLTESLQSELVGTNISVLIVHPGEVKTNIIKNAPDLTGTQQREEVREIFTQAAGLSSEKAVEKILDAVKVDKKQLVFGTDVVIVNAIRSISLGRFPRILQIVFSRMTIN